MSATTSLSPLTTSSATSATSAAATSSSTSIFDNTTGFQSKYLFIVCVAVFLALIFGLTAWNYGYRRHRPHLMQSAGAQLPLRDDGRPKLWEAFVVEDEKGVSSRDTWVEMKVRAYRLAGILSLTMRHT